MQKLINVATDFSRYPAGRFYDDGPFSGEKFREEFLRPVIDVRDTAEIELDGVRGYGSSFLEEAFGGLVRAGFNTDLVKQTFKLKSSDQSLITEILEYIQHGSE